MADRNTKIRGVQINADVAGAGLAKDASFNLKVNLETSNPGLAITDDKLDVKLVANDGLARGTNGLSVDYDNSSIGIVSNKLAVKASGVTDTMLAEDYIQTDEVDDVTVEFASGNILQVKAGGISETQLNVSVNASLDLADSAIQTELDPVFTAWDKSTGISITESQISDLRDYIETTDVDDVTLEMVSADLLQVKDGGITEPKLAMNDSPSAGEVITWNASGYMEWTSKIATDAVANADIRYENESANCNGSEDEFTLETTPVANSVQVFLNGLLQEAGSGKDYTISGTTITFADEPVTGDILLIHYIAQA